MEIIKRIYNAVMLKNSSGTVINPATEETLSSVDTKLTTIDTTLTDGTQKTQITSFPTDSPNFDSFDRLRVSNPTTLFDSKQLWDNAPLFWDDSEVSGSGTTSSHSTDTASTTIGVALSTAGKRVRQTYQCFNYQPGKSQLIIMTFVTDLSGGGAGVVREIGIGEDNNGLFLQDDEGTYKFVRRTSTSGSAVDSDVSQTNWNIDTLDGAGSSGITIDFTKTQIMVIDFEWLGVGRVRLGFVFDGIIVYAHEFLNANNLSEVYMSSPNLPLRLSIENTGAGAASTLSHICSTVISEGGATKTGALRHKDSGSISSLSSGTTYAVIGIRLKSTHIDAAVLIESLSMISTSQNDQAHWELYINPTVAGTFTYSDMTNSSIQTATGSSSNTITNGTELDGGFFETSAPTTTVTPNAIRIGAAIDGTVDTLVLTVKPITNNITIQGSMTWRELS